MIDRFEDQYTFLSNFYPCTILYKGVIFPSLENAYQAAKYSGEDALNVYQEFAGFTPGKAKGLLQNYFFAPSYFSPPLRHKP